MQIEFRHFSIPKDGNSAEENEDSFYPVKSPDGETNEFKCAVADGAGTCSWSNIWAQQLTKSYCREEWSSPEQILDLAKHLGARWRAYAEKNLNPNVFWAPHVLSQGAAAALVGLTIRQCNGSNELEWTALAIGDSCLFHLNIPPSRIVPGGQLVGGRSPLNCSYPSIILPPNMEVEDFSHNPYILSTHVEQNMALSNRIYKTDPVRLKENDTFLLASDALSCCISRCNRDERHDLIEKLISVNSEDEFRNVIKALKAEPQPSCEPYLKNDDQTMMLVRVTKVATPFRRTTRKLRVLLGVAAIVTVICLLTYIIHVLLQKNKPHPIPQAPKMPQAHIQSQSNQRHGQAKNGKPNEPQSGNAVKVQPPKNADAKPDNRKK